MPISSSIKSERNSSIELLRIVAGLMVVVLHFNYLPGGGGAIDNTDGLSKTFLLILEVVCICAVNVFILITGYFSVDKNGVKTGKLFEILLQTMFFSFCYSLLMQILGGGGGDIV